MSATPDPSPEQQKAFADYFYQKSEFALTEKINAMFVQALTTPKPPPPPLPPVDLSNTTERLRACILGLGYVAGLAGGKRPAVWAAGSPNGHTWETGYRQGREHRARSLERAEPPDTFSFNRIAAGLLRAQPIPR